MSGRPRARVAAGVLVAACAAPHAVRWFSDAVVLQDGFYAHAAFMLSRGHAPYADFVLPAFPLAEGVLAALVAAFGHDVRVTQAATLAMIAATAFVLHRAARRTAVAAPARAGAAAALAWCASLWVLHFHLFERETWAALGTALALLAAAGPPGADARAEPSTRRCAAVAAGLLLAFLVKITGAFAAAGLCAHFLLTGRPRATLRVGGLFLLGAGAATALGAALWGGPFLQQVWLFGLFRSPEAGSALERGRQLLLWSDPALLAGLSALLAVGLPGLLRPCGAAACVLLAQLAFALLVNDTLWEHNLIELMPAAALLVGAAADAWARRRVALVAAAGALAVGITLADGPWLAGDYGPGGAGFGGWPRETLTRRARFLERWSGPDDVVLTTDPWWSFQAGRVEAVRYWDLAPQAQGLSASLAADGLLATLAKRHGPLVLAAGRPDPDPRALRVAPYAARSVANAIVHTRPRLLDELSARRVALVVEPLPPAVLAPVDLRAAGYERFEDHELGQAGWRPRDPSR